ncbi:MAG: TolC family protein [Acidobacteria bacterium]|nr:TolC family protein [Acidobacteriota bacterium]
MILLMWWPAATFAQAPLTLDQAVQEALAHNRSLLGARAAARESAAHVTEARAGFFPRVSFTESWQRGDQPVFVFSSLLSARKFGAANFAVDALNSPDPTGFFRGAFSIDQEIFDGGRTRASVRSARLQQDIAGLGADEAAAGLAGAVSQTYGRAVAADAITRAADGAVAAAQEDVTRAERRRDAGTMTDADVLALAVHLAEVRQRRIQAAGDYAVARAELNRLTGSPIDREFAVQEPLLTPASGDGPSLAALFAEADASRPDLRRSAAAEQLANTGRELARAAWYPQVGAQAGYEVAGTQLTDRASSWIVGAELRWNLSLGGAEQARARAAAETATRSRLDREDARAAAQVEIVTALRRLESARARQAVGSAAVTQAHESERIIRNRFDAGVAGANDVLRASSAVLDAESQRIAALVDAVVSRAMLDRAVGRHP